VASHELLELLNGQLAIGFSHPRKLSAHRGAGKTVRWDSTPGYAREGSLEAATPHGWSRRVTAATLGNRLSPRCANSRGRGRTIGKDDST
jgi:hypothetical protein